MSRRLSSSGAVLALRADDIEAAALGCRGDDGVRIRIRIATETLSQESID